jgi:rSAM/selenodomain-associated transferase 1
MMLRRSEVVYVMAKAPQPGAAKTRLCPPLQPAQAARLAEAFLRDAVAIVERAGCQGRIMCRGDAERLALENLLRASTPVQVQTGAGLGDALESAFRQGLADGCEAVGVLGADSPTLPPAVVREAFVALRRGADVALGPSDDGGYYLLAARALHSALFHDMPWSTSAVGALTLARCREAGLSTHLLPTWYDVDDGASLARLQAELRTGAPSLAPLTRAALGIPAAEVPRPAPAPLSYGALA